MIILLIAIICICTGSVWIGLGLIMLLAWLEGSEPKKKLSEMTREEYWDYMGRNT